MSHLIFRGYGVENSHASKQIENVLKHISKIIFYFNMKGKKYRNTKDIIMHRIY